MSEMLFLRQSVNTEYRCSNATAVIWAHESGWQYALTALKEVFYCTEYQEKDRRKCSTMNK